MASTTWSRRDGPIQSARDKSPVPGLLIQPATFCSLLAANLLALRLFSFCPRLLPLALCQAAASPWAAQARSACGGPTGKVLTTLLRSHLSSLGSPPSTLALRIPPTQLLKGHRVNLTHAPLAATPSESSSSALHTVPLLA